MVHNHSSVPEPRPGDRQPARDGWRHLVTPTGGPRAPAAPVAPDEVATVFGWLQRCTASTERAEDLTVEVFRQRTRTGPACLAEAGEEIRLQHLVVSVVLRARGTL